MNLLLKRGQRGLLVGQTGSGKTQNAIWQLRNSAQWPVIIFDTKFEDDFLGLPEGDEKITVIQSLREFLKYSKKPAHDYIIVRPSPTELTDHELLDMYNGIVYDRMGPCLTYYDEIYSWHQKGQPGKYFVGLLTRGRSRGKTVLMASQRPSWLSRFCLTEAQKFYIHNLTHTDDMKTLGHVIPGMGSMPKLPRFHFYYFEHGEMEGPKASLPVPWQPLDRKKINQHRWI